MTRDGPRGTARDARRDRAHDARSDTARDAQRARVYAAENFVRTMFDRAAERGDPVVEFFGTSLTLPPEARFSSAETVQRYVDEVLAHPAVRERWPVVAPLRVRTRRGHTAAHYECGADADGLGGARAAAIIAVPERGSSWALRELVVLHEITHHLVYQVNETAAAHGHEFVVTFCELADAVMGPEAAHVLRVVYAKEGAR
jgi:putative metallohydrolase (TIGR04338 family)